MNRICFVLCGMVLFVAGCGDDTSVVERALPTPAPEVDAGVLHNEIARAFSEKLDQASLGTNGGAPSRKQFVKLMVDASNETLKERGLAETVSAKDINRTLNEFVDLRNRGVFDIYSSRPGDLRRVVDDWEARGVIATNDAIAIRARLRGDYEVDLLPPSDTVKMVESVWSASKELWSDPAFSVKRKRPAALGDDGVPDKESIRFQVDGIFTLFGLLFGPVGATVGGVTSSLIFEMFPPADTPGESWDCSDYCNMA